MLLQTNSYIVPKERRAEHARLLRRFRQTLTRLGCDYFEVYEQVGANWSSEQATGRFVQIMRFRDRRHQLAVQAAERSDVTAQQLIAEFCELINFPYQQQQGLFAVGFYTSIMPVAPLRPGQRAPLEDQTADEQEVAAAQAASAAAAATAEVAPPDQQTYAAQRAQVAEEQPAQEMPAEQAPVPEAVELRPVELDDQPAEEHAVQAADEHRSEEQAIEPEAIEHEPEAIEHEPEATAPEPVALEHEPATVEHEPAAIEHEPQVVGEEPEIQPGEEVPLSEEPLTEQPLEIEDIDDAAHEPEHAHGSNGKLVEGSVPQASDESARLDPHFDDLLAAHFGPAQEKREDERYPGHAPSERSESGSGIGAVLDRGLLDHDDLDVELPAELIDEPESVQPANPSAHHPHGERVEDESHHA